MNEKKKEPLFHIVKRDAIPWYQSLGIRAAAIVLALILGPLAESNLHRSLLLSQGSASIFFTRPICIFFLLLAVLSLCWPLLRKALSNRKKAA